LKKSLILGLILSILITCTGCTNIKSKINEDKPQSNYYSQELIKSINHSNPKRISVFYKEFFDKFEFPSAESEDVISFINLLEESYFIEKPEDLPDTYKYKVYLEFEDEKYVITVFSEKYISIYNWDGKYKVDYVNITEVPLSYNIYGICKYFTEE